MNLSDRQIDSALKVALSNLDASRTKLQSEYDAIIQSAKKQAENIKRQIIGFKSSDSKK